MKKLLLIVILIVFLISSAYSQDFQIHFQDTVAYGQPGDFMIILGEAINLSQTDTLVLRMVRLQNNLPAGNWASLICLGFCAAPHIDTIDYVIPAGDTVATDVNFQTDGTTAGTATVLIKYTTLNASQEEFQWFVASTELNSIESDDDQFAFQFKLLNNYPNPFNNQTVISTQVNKTSELSLQIFDVLGREVYSENRRVSSAGIVYFRWSGIDNFNNVLSSGVYFYRVTANTNNTVNQSEIKKLTLLR